MYGNKNVNIYQVENNNRVDIGKVKFAVVIFISSSLGGIGFKEEEKNVIQQWSDINAQLDFLSKL